MRLCVALLGLSLVACATDGAPETAEDPQNDIPETKEAAAEAQTLGKADWSLDPCQWRGWYGDGVCDWFCPRRDSDCDKADLFASPTGHAASFPILLTHGFDASPQESVVNRWSFWKVKQTLEADGHLVCEAEVPPYDSVANRAQFLAAAVDDCLIRTGAQAVNIIAHSMGGLDSRYIISTMGYGDVVVSLTMLSTAHRGTNVADFALKLTPGLVDPVLDAIVELWGKTFSDSASDSSLRAALTGLSKQEAPRFNAANPDDDRVLYQSWAGVSTVFGIEARAKVEAACGGASKVFIHKGTADRMHGTIKPLAPIAAEGTKSLVTDGMIPVSSSKWGEFRGCIPADHMDEVGQYRNEGTNPDTGWNHLSFYRTLAYDLAARGF